jgi:brefeldin A-inhibited guanine nucleotide-exchange protein
MKLCETLLWLLYVILLNLAALDNGSTDAAIIFTPFQIACRSGNSELLVIAIDCLGKLFSYNYWKAAPNHVKGNEDDDNDGTNSMIVFVVDTLCDGFSGETTDEKVQLQLIKALQAAVTNADPAFSLHGATLLKAIRTCYNIFLLSTSMHVQHAAQATVIHMVQNVMSRIPVSQKGEPLNVSQNSVPESNEEQSNNTKSMDSIKEYDREIKDAYKVLRTLCLLSQKPVPATEGVLDLRSQLIRSKLLALHLLTTTLKANIKVFLVKSKVLATLADDKENHDMLFIDALKNMLFVSLTRNATSTVPPIFEVALELFGVLMHLRAFLKKEIGVFFTEIVIPILEDKKNITWYQRYFLLKTIGNILSDPANEGGKLLVEIFINYDCDVQSSAKENIWERLCLALSRILSQHDTNQLPSSSLFIPINSYVTGDSKDAPPLTTVNLVALSRDQVKELYSTNGDPVELKRECLRFLVGGILHPLGIWCDFMSNQSKTKILPNTEDTEKEAPATLTIDADPETIGSQKQRKQAISEGVKRFNFKPKKGFQYLIDTKCIASMDPKEIARFLLFTEGIKKSAIGEFLGEG